MASILRLVRKVFTSKPNYPSTSRPNHRFIHTLDIRFNLLNFKQNPTKYATHVHDLRKNFAMDVIENIRSRKAKGIHGGSLALYDIQVIGSRATLPQNIYQPTVHKDYIEGYKDFFDDLFGGNDEPLDDVYYMDLKSYMKDLETMEQLLLLLRHPYFQTVAEALRFIPSVVKILDDLGARFPDPLKTADNGYQYAWHRVYRDMWRKEGVNIKESINRLSSAHHKHMFTSLYQENNYKATDGVHELYFYATVCEQMNHVNEKVRALREGFTNVPIKAFKVFRTYPGYYDGRINLDFVRPLRPLLKTAKERIDS